MKIDGDAQHRSPSLTEIKTTFCLMVLLEIDTVQDTWLCIFYNKV